MSVLAVFFKGSVAGDGGVSRDPQPSRWEKKTKAACLPQNPWKKPSWKRKNISVSDGSVEKKMYPHRKYKLPSEKKQEKWTAGNAHDAQFAAHPRVARIIKVWQVFGVKIEFDVTVVRRRRRKKPKTFSKKWPFLAFFPCMNLWSLPARLFERPQKWSKNIGVASNAVGRLLFFSALRCGILIWGQSHCHSLPRTWEKPKTKIRKIPVFCSKTLRRPAGKNSDRQDTISIHPCLYLPRVVAGNDYHHVRSLLFSRRRKKRHCEKRRACPLLLLRLSFFDCVHLRIHFHHIWFHPRTHHRIFCQRASRPEFLLNERHGYAKEHVSFPPKKKCRLSRPVLFKTASFLFVAF